ncbi:MAG TPA: tetratricopeptide repeat protein [Flavobacteriales bacterium]|nr:tetratricopeptide repeat protein [Flavobacteriales bacterium]
MRMLLYTTLLMGGLFLAHHAGAQNAALLIGQGDSLLVQNAASKALDKYNAAVEAGHTADAYAGRARAWYALGKYDKFLADVNTALEKDSLHGKANYQRALYALRAGDNAGAIRAATTVLDAGPDPDLRRHALVVRGEARAANGATQPAIADLAEGLMGDTGQVDAMKTLARLQDAANDPAASLATLEKLCELQPLDIGNWSNRGFELNRLERYEEAIQVLDRALQLDKDEPVVLSNKAYSLFKLGRDTEALSTVNRSLKADRSNPYALRTRALLYLRKGDRNKACNDLTLAKAMGGAPEVDALVKQHCEGIEKKR